MFRLRCFQINCFVCSLLFAAGVPAADVSFDMDVRPILVSRCVECHGADVQESGLRIDRRQSLLKGGDSGEPAVQPGISQDSRLIHLVSARDSAQRMPPDGPPLSADQIQTLKAWIDQGAKMPEEFSVSPAVQSDHWSLQRVRRPEIPAAFAAEANNAIDAFVLRKLEQSGLRASVRARPRTLIRRLYLVMHGLPPTVAQLRRWVPALETDFDRAWPQLVDSVLASERYGERWARHWLDIVRFGETHGFETNRERPNAWPYRDYVIRAFNSDLPYDQFVKEQLAGDATGAHAATGFLVAGPHDIVKSPDRALTLMQRQDELTDLVNVTGTTFMGLTLGCARCHNHKFDPVSQRDFYAMQAIFCGVHHGERNVPLTKDASGRRQTLQHKVDEVRVQLCDFVPADTRPWVLLDDAATAGIGQRGVRAFKPPAGTGTNPAGTSRGFLNDPGAANRAANLSGGRYTWWSADPGEDVFQWQPLLRGKYRVWISWGTGFDTHTKDARYLLDRDGFNDTTSDRMEFARVDQRRFADGSLPETGKPLWSGFEDAGIHEFHPATTIVLKNGSSKAAVTADVILLQAVSTEQNDSVQHSGELSSVPDIRPAVDARVNEDVFEPVLATHLRFRILKTTSAEPCLDELEVWSGENNVARADRGTVAVSSGDLQGYDIHKLAHINDGRYGNQHSWISSEVGRGWVELSFDRPYLIDRVTWGRDRTGKYSDRLATDYVIETSQDGQTWTVVSSAAGRLPNDSADTAQPEYRADAAGPDRAAEGNALLKTLQQLLSEVRQLSGTTALYAGTFSKPPVVHRLYRGDPLSPREAVVPGVPEVLGTLHLTDTTPEQDRRVEFARWLTSTEHSLTARVMVNRLWQHHFGTGIVATANDFGVNGAAPSHPELLDWLAAELMAGGWSVKHIQRTILLSATWQQSNVPNEAGLATDAGSRLLWRFPPRRLEAEAIRDSVLAVSGALDLKMGGPGFSGFEVQMENVRHFFPKQTYGPQDFRRMIYMTKVRQEQETVFGVFDCPDASQVISGRSRSTTPLQALSLMNSRFMVGQSERMAKRLQQTEHLPKAQARLAFELCFSRPPDDEELTDAVLFIREYGLAAFCRAMLNTSEFLFIP